MRRDERWDMVVVRVEYDRPRLECRNVNVALVPRTE